VLSVGVERALEGPWIGWAEVVCPVGADAWDKRWVHSLIRLEKIVSAGIATINKSNSYKKINVGSLFVTRKGWPMDMFKSRLQGRSRKRKQWRILSTPAGKKVLHLLLEVQRTSFSKLLTMIQFNMNRDFLMLLWRNALYFRFPGAMGGPRQQVCETYSFFHFVEINLNSLQVAFWGLAGIDKQKEYPSWIFSRECGW
jgi:hypothetical protein